jgi:hypothetical protein
MLCTGRRDTRAMTGIALGCFNTQYQNADDDFEAKVKSTSVHSDVGKASADPATRGPPKPEGKI